MQSKHPDLLAFGIAVRKVRQAKGLSQEDLAEKADLDRTYISGIERGLRNPTLLSSLCIANALGVTLDKLVKGIGHGA